MSAQDTQRWFKIHRIPVLRETFRKWSQRTLRARGDAPHVPKKRGTRQRKRQTTRQREEESLSGSHLGLPHCRRLPLQLTCIMDDDDDDDDDDNDNDNDNDK